VHDRANQAVTVSQDAPYCSTSRRTTGVASSRATVTPLAGVTRAVGPNSMDMSADPLACRQRYRHAQILP